ncbi:MAG: GMP synthase [Phaeodactylibacter sp.]|nr:GMP synthase [Phaeodactylibacter sp.]MCB9302285.1 GMP synthase [Lewinellaceae bacterium]
MEVIRLAILDMYENTPNQGMRAIKEIVRSFEPTLEWKVFNVRGKAELPGPDFDIYISTGGPGNPHDGDGDWDVKYFQWLQDTWEWNQSPERPKKYVFFICHSFQMAVKHFGLAKVSRRKSMSFGTFPCHLTDAGVTEPVFEGLPNPFYIADFRNWQCIEPDLERFEAMGAEILALEKIRPHVPLERALMAVRFSSEFVGTQFHPEADPEGMLDHFLDPGRRTLIAEEHGEEKYLRMIEHLNDSDKIGLTHDIVLPLFLSQAIGAVKMALAPA